eukprot:TRINITY_DN17001_c0_g1_i1.p1 TRINITY_DN17001_c0_g1~~TRINITY_DN17001_c0_g1_i1.p1  ORF type:complete len:339 (-),score=23.35 TRINITY_DN17001_c0_g1_i1:436-1452(-)
MICNRYNCSNTFLYLLPRSFKYRKLQQISTITPFTTIIPFDKNCKICKNGTINKIISIFNNCFLVLKSACRSRQTYENIDQFFIFVSSCLLFLSKFDDQNPNTWVVRYNLLDASYVEKYFASFHWVFQTLTTVGFGEITPSTMTEKIFAILWMMIGVVLFSFALGQIGELLAQMDNKEHNVKQKMKVFSESASKIKLPYFLCEKIQNFFEINMSEKIYPWVDPQRFFSDLPIHLRKELTITSYRDIIDQFSVLKEDRNFTTQIIQMLYVVHIPEKEILYREDDLAEEIYFLIKGAINYCTQNGVAFITVYEGQLIGEIEIFENTHRQYFAQARESSTL